MPAIKSSADLRNGYNEISNFCHTYNEPVFITKNGYGKLVVMDIALFEQMMNELYIAKSLKEGIDDVKNGNVKDASQVLEEMKLKYGL